MLNVFNGDVNQSDTWAAGVFLKTNDREENRIRLVFKQQCKHNLSTFRTVKKRGRNIWKDLLQNTLRSTRGGKEEEGGEEEIQEMKL